MMKQPSMKLADVPLFSHVEATEIVRQMPLLRRVAFMLVVMLGTLLGLVLVTGLAVLVAALLLNLFFDYTFFADGELIFDNVMMFSLFPVTLTMMLALGLSAQDHGESIKPGESLLVRGRTAMRHGLVSGVLVGLGFGMLWYFAVYIGVIYIELNTLLDPDLQITEFLLYGLVMAVAVAPLLALYRGFLAVFGPVMLDRLRRPYTIPSESRR